MRRPLVVVLVVAVAFVAGGGAAWGWEARAVSRAGSASRDRVARAVTADRQDDGLATGLAARSAGVAGRDLAGGARDALAQAIPGAQATLDASAGRVADAAVRQELSAAIAAAHGVPASAAPAVADEILARLTAAAAAVAAAQQEWQAARTAHASARAAPRPATPTPVDTCRTTYNGPAFYTSVPAVEGDPTANGRLPASVMAPVSWATDSRGDGYWFVKAATASLEELDTAFLAAFGHHLDIDLAYRDHATQVAMYQALGPSVAASPGTSHHGWGTAFDVPEWPCQYGLRTAERDWLVAHGPTWHWFPDPSEYWHYDYKP
jgi:hypothetical protein